MGCIHHIDHENRLKALEGKAHNPAIWVALFSFLGVVFTTIGSLLGIVISALLKGGG